MGNAELVVVAMLGGGLWLEVDVFRLKWNDDEIIDWMDRTDDEVMNKILLNNAFFTATQEAQKEMEW